MSEINILEQLELFLIHELMDKEHESKVCKTTRLGKIKSGIVTFAKMVKKYTSAWKSRHLKTKKHIRNVNDGDEVDESDEIAEVNQLMIRIFGVNLESFWSESET